VKVLVTGLMAHSISLVILLVVSYYPRAHQGRPLTPRVILIMSQVAALFALAPATVYVLLAELLRKHR
jgi:hypothetical protein